MRPRSESPPSDRLRIVIADTDRVFATVLAGRLGNHEEFDVVGFARDADETVTLVRDLKPALVVIDSALPGVDGIEAATRVRELPDPPAVVLLTAEDFEAGAGAWEGGVFAYVRKAEVMPLIDVIAGVSRLVAAPAWFCAWHASQN